MLLQREIRYKCCGRERIFKLWVALYSMPTLNWIGKEAVVNHDKEVAGKSCRRRSSRFMQNFVCLNEKILEKHNIQFKQIYYGVKVY